MKHSTISKQNTIVSEYLNSDISCVELGQKYHLHENTIIRWLENRGIKRRASNTRFNRKYTLNENYFDKIDTEAKAYFLGLLYADGCNSEDLHRFDINLQEEDRYILELLCQELETNKPLELRIKKNKKHKNAVSITITSHRISIQLAKLGCVQRKSLILEFVKPNLIPENLMHHFVRGYFDGDGCVTKYNKLGIKLCIASTEKFCLGLHNYLSRYFQLDWRFYKNCKKTGNLITTVMQLGKFKQIYTFLFWLYKDATVYLKRKYDNWLFFKEKQDNLKNFDIISKHDDRRKYLKFYLKQIC